LSDNWTEFSLQMFQSTRKQSTTSNQSETSNGLTKRIEVLQKAGEIGAIVKLINQSSERLQVDNDIIQKLQAKHPAPVSPVPDEFKTIIIYYYIVIYIQITHNPIT